MLDHPLAVRRAVFRRRVRRGSLRKHSRRGEHGAGQREYQSCLLHGEISPVDAVKILSGREPENTCRAHCKSALPLTGCAAPDLARPAHLVPRYPPKSSREFKTREKKLQGT